MKKIIIFMFAILFALSPVSGFGVLSGEAEAGSGEGMVEKTLEGVKEGYKETAEKLAKVVKSKKPEVEPGQSIFIKVMEGVPGGFEGAAGNLKSALESAGWDVIATYNAGLPKDCSYKARVFIFSSEKYTGELLAKSELGRFAIPLRAALYEDENGISIAVLNIVTLNRFIAPGLEGFSRETLDTITASIAKKAGGVKVMEDAGPVWTTGDIKGFGGGMLSERVLTLYTVRHKSALAFENFIGDVNREINNSQDGWEPVYKLDLRDQGLFIFGLSKRKVEGRAFRITGKKRVVKENNCPGIDHAPAFPIEVVVSSRGERIQLDILQERFRMKLYFADAGEMAFIKHLFMPGNVEGEIISSVLPCYFCEQ